MSAPIGNGQLEVLGLEDPEAAWVDQVHLQEVDEETARFDDERAARVAQVLGDDTEPGTWSRRLALRNTP